LHRSYRDNAYLAFIRKQPCCVTGSSGDIHAHHIRQGTVAGTGIKPSDYRAVPLSPTSHFYLHQKGEKAFWEMNAIDPEILVMKFLTSFWLQNQWGLHHLIEKMEEAIYVSRGIDDIKGRRK